MGRKLYQMKILMKNRRNVGTEIYIATEEAAGNRGKYLRKRRSENME
jgi:hypothetical protein